MASGGGEKRLEENTVEVCTCVNKSRCYALIKHCHVYIIHAVFHGFCMVW